MAFGAGIAAADAAQLVLLDLPPARVMGAAGGAVIYATVAVAAARRARWPALVAMAMPAFPAALVVAWAAGLAPPPPPVTLAIAVVQGVAAVAGALSRSGSGPPGDAAQAE